jgi:hypothetical protein
MLKLSPEQKAKHADYILKEPDEVSFVAIRVWDHPDSIKIDWAGKLKGKENKTADGTSIANYFGVPDAPTSEAEVPFLSLIDLFLWLIPVSPRRACGGRASRSGKASMGLSMWKREPSNTTTKNTDSKGMYTYCSCRWQLT